MPKRTGEMTLTDIRRRYDAERLIGCRVTKARSFADAWKLAFPESSANRPCAESLGCRLFKWYCERFPEDWSTLFDRMRRQRLPRRFIARSDVEQVAAAIIFCHVVLRLPLVECWRRVVPESPANNNANSARTLAQRYATRLIRKYPEAPRQIVEGSIRRWVKLFPEAKNHFRGGQAGSYPDAVSWPFYCSAH